MAVRRAEEEFDYGHGEGPDVDWQEKYIDKLDRDMSEMKASLRHLEEHMERQIDRLVTEVRGTNKWVIGLVISAIIGITAIAISVVTFVASVL